jgi:hypothetical protein
MMMLQRQLILSFSLLLEIYCQSNKEKRGGKRERKSHFKV